jgi:tRNA pseudouridine55 synthase
MQKVLNLYKPVGLSPLQLASTLRHLHPEYQDVKLGYAGRLDPMADGVLLMLTGDENKKRRMYEALDKKYSFDCLFGYSSDTFDTLGIARRTDELLKEQLVAQLPEVLTAIAQLATQEYPAYSSRTVNGKPLYFYARHGLLDEITIPSHPIKILELNLQSINTISARKLLKTITNNVQKVHGDFRQKDIIQNWQELLSNRNTNLLTATCNLSCTSGTYVRGICEAIGIQLGIGALALRITRESVGSYILKDSLIVQ